MGSIKNVVSEPIEGHEDYHMMVTVLAATCTSDSVRFMTNQNVKLTEAKTTVHVHNVTEQSQEGEVCMILVWKKVKEQIREII